MISRSRAISIETPSRMRNGRWRCRYRWFDEYGKRKSASAYGDTAAAARNQAQLVGNIELARVEAIQRGCDPGPLFMPTFAEVAADALVSTIPTRQKARQQRTTRIYLDKWWLPAIGDKAIDAITPGDLNRVIANARQHVADATCNRILCAAAVVFRHAELERLIEHVPTTGGGGSFSRAEVLARVEQEAPDLVDWRHALLGSLPTDRLITWDDAFPVLVRLLRFARAADGLRTG